MTTTSSGIIPPGNSLVSVAGMFHTLAVDAYNRITATAQPTDPRQNDALSAIILSVVSLEAALNELEALARNIAPNFPSDQRSAKLVSVLERIKQAHRLPWLAQVLRIVVRKFSGSPSPRLSGSVADKLEAAFTILTGTSYNKGAAPFQDFATLIKVRNALVHPNAFSFTILSSGAVMTDPVEQLKQKVRSLGILANYPTDSPEPWADWVATKAAARWACNTAAAIVHSLFPSSNDALQSTLRTSLANNFVPIP
jgi:hypothetical protein